MVHADSSVDLGGVPMLSRYSSSDAAQLPLGLEATTATVEGGPPHPRRRRMAVARLLLVFALLIIALVVAKLSGLTDRIDKEAIREAMEKCGPYGVLAFVAVFALGELMHIPGMVFVAAAVIAYGRLWGGLLSYVAANVSVCVGFVCYRAVGGKSTLYALGLPRRVEQLLHQLEARPVRVIVVLRLLMWLAPALNAALGLTRVRFLPYALGSALGLLAPITGMVLVFA